MDKKVKNKGLNVDIDTLFNEIIENSSEDDKDELSSLSWNRYGDYKLVQYVKRFFLYKPKLNKELDLEDVVKNLLSPFTEESILIPKETLDKCEDLLHHQRTLEDTRARRRLEKWATKVISRYLFSVFIILVINGCAGFIVRLISWFCDVENVPEDLLKSGFLSDEVMIVILSTTTINIIGLGLIVLKGHSPSKDNKKQ